MGGRRGRTDSGAPAERIVKDAVGNVLQDGDSVVVVKALKGQGSPSGLKAGRKVRGIRLVDGVDGHDIDCKIDGFGAMQLKSSVVKKGSTSPPQLLGRPGSSLMLNCKISAIG